MPHDDEPLSLVGSEIPCPEDGCDYPALTTCKYCWKHLPDADKSCFKEKIERLAIDRKGDLQNFILQGANLFYADLQGVYLFGAELQGAYLRWADLQGVHLQFANLQGADLARAKLQGADLERANLQGADLGWANLQETKLAGLKYDKKYDKRRVSFIRADIRNIDWSKNPLLKRHIEDQQFLQAYKEKPQKSLWRKGWHKAWRFLWWMTCDYGQNFWLWLAWSLGLGVFFGFLYADYHWYQAEVFWRWPGLKLFLFKINPQIYINPHGADNWITPYYYSFTTFTTLGLGDVIPKNLPAQIAVIAEVLLGYIMLGGLISIFANKLARRS